MPNPINVTLSLVHETGERRCDVCHDIIYSFNKMHRTVIMAETTRLGTINMCDNCVKVAEKANEKS